MNDTVNDVVGNERDDGRIDEENGEPPNPNPPCVESTSTTAKQEEDSTIASREEVISPSSSPPPSSSRNCCLATMWHYDVPEALGYAYLVIGRGAAIMSFVLVNVALVELASEAAGCETGADECTGTVYGLNPVSLISGVPMVSGLLGAFFMPVIGVILDFTSYRRFVGILFSVVFTVIQVIQIAIGEQTWFAVTILQAIAGFCFTVIGVTNYAYLPEICDKVGQAKHGLYTSRYVAKQFSAMTLFMVLASGLSFAFGIADDSVLTARLSQGLVSAILCIMFGFGWRHMPSRQATRELPQGIRGFGIIVYGIRQNVRTIVSIHRVYKKGLRWYLLATMFANATVTAVTSTSVVYLSAEVGMNAVDVSMFMLVVLVGTVSGTLVALLVLKRANPLTSWEFTMLYICLVLVIGSQTLGDARSKYLSLFWGFFVGVGLGWYYPAENLLFSCILPKGQEAEIAGFRMYCTIILAWFTPLVFGILVQKGVDPKWGMTFIGCFILIPAAMLRFCAGTWEEILEESGRTGAALTTSPVVRSVASIPVSPEPDVSGV